jgi:hypothetical protein
VRRCAVFFFFLAAARLSARAEEEDDDDDDFFAFDDELFLEVSGAAAAACPTTFSAVAAIFPKVEPTVRAADVNAFSESPELLSVFFSVVSKLCFSIRLPDC